jgi:lysophospholipase L1-like esterase
MKMKSYFAMGFACVAVAYGATATEKSDFYLKDGDRVVFYGDSITDQRQYTVYTELFAVTRFPKTEVTFIHSGWGGDRVTGGGGGPIDLRLKRDVFAYKPTVMTVMLGMNDASYRAFDQNIFAQYTNGYEHIVSEMKKNFPHIRMILIQPSPYDDVTRPVGFEGGYNKVLNRYGEYIKELAEREHLDLADLNTAVTATTEKANSQNHEIALKINPDRVHPAQPGQMLMAAELLKSWHAPALVSSVEIDAASDKPGKTERARITGVSRGNGKLSWMEKDEALPMPIHFNDATMALAINSSDFMDSLNQENLKVTGLTASKYNLSIDGQKVETLSKEDLEKGVNLARFQTPMWKQAQEVLTLTRRHNDVHFTRWRQVQVPLEKAGELPHMAEALRGLDDLEKDFVKQQRAAAQPKEHKYELSAAE